MSPANEQYEAGDEQAKRAEQTPEFSTRCAKVMHSPYLMKLPGNTAVERQEQRNKFLEAILAAADYDQLPDDVRATFDKAEAATK